MLALLLAIALAALTAVVLLLAGVIAAFATGIALLNAFVVFLGARARALHCSKQQRAANWERWRPSSFRRAPEPPPTEVQEDEERHSVTIRRR
jgi:uncharacterized protein (DUF58 family)